jgi:hypothetical protein
MTIQISKSELLKTVKFGVGKKLLENKKVSIFDSKFELLLENVEPSDRKELINEFFGRKVDYSNPDKMIRDWQSSKAGRKFIEIFNQISPESDFNSNNLFDDKAAWNALRLANDVTDGKYNVEDAKDFQRIFLKNKGGQNSSGGSSRDNKAEDPKIWEPTGFGGQKFSLAELSELIKAGKMTDDHNVKVVQGASQSSKPLNMYQEWKDFLANPKKKPEEAKKNPTRRRDLEVAPAQLQPLQHLPPEVSQFLKEVRFKHYFDTLLNQMMNMYMRTLEQNQKDDFVQIIEDHFDNIFGTFLTESQFSLQEVRQAIREVLQGRKALKEAEEKPLSLQAQSLLARTFHSIPDAENKEAANYLGVDRVTVGPGRVTFGRVINPAAHGMGKLPGVKFFVNGKLYHTQDLTKEENILMTIGQPFSANLTEVSQKEIEERPYYQEVINKLLQDQGASSQAQSTQNPSQQPDVSASKTASQNLNQPTANEPEKVPVAQPIATTSPLQAAAPTTPVATNNPSAAAPVVAPPNAAPPIVPVANAQKTPVDANAVPATANPKAPPNPNHPKSVKEAVEQFLIIPVSQTISEAIADSKLMSIFPGAAVVSGRGAGGMQLVLVPKTNLQLLKQKILFLIDNVLYSPRRNMIDYVQQKKGADKEKATVFLDLVQFDESEKDALAKVAESIAAGRHMQQNQKLKEFQKNFNSDIDQNIDAFNEYMGNKATEDQRAEAPTDSQLSAIPAQSTGVNVPNQMPSVQPKAQNQSQQSIEGAQTEPGLPSFSSSKPAVQSRAPSQVSPPEEGAPTEPGLPAFSGQMPSVQPSTSAPDSAASFAGAKTVNMPQGSNPGRTLQNIPPVSSRAKTVNMPQGSNPGRTLRDLSQLPPQAGPNSKLSTPAAAAPVQATPNKADDEEFNRIGKTQVLTPAEQKIPLEIIGEMYKPIVKFLFDNAKKLPEAPRKKTIVTWINDVMKQMGEEFKETKAALASAAQPAAAAAAAPVPGTSANSNASAIAPPVAKPAAAQRGPGGRFLPKNPKAPVQNAGAAPAKGANVNPNVGAGAPPAAPPVAKPVVTTSPSAAAASTQAPTSKTQSGVVPVVAPPADVPPEAAASETASSTTEPISTGSPEAPVKASPTNDVEKMRENIRAQVLNADKIKKVLEGDQKTKTLLKQMTQQEYEQAYNKAVEAFNGVLAEPDIEDFLGINFSKTPTITEARNKKAPQDKVQLMYGFIIDAMKKVLKAEYPNNAVEGGPVDQLFAKINAPVIAPTSAPTDEGHGQVIANIIKKVDSQEIIKYLANPKNQYRNLLEKIEGGPLEEKTKNIIYSYYMAKAAINTELHRFVNKADTVYTDRPDAKEAFASLLKETTTRLAPEQYFTGDNMKTLTKKIVDIFFDFLTAKVGEINQVGLNEIKSGINRIIEKAQPTISPPTEIETWIKLFQEEIWPGTVKQEANPPASGGEAPINNPSDELPAGAAAPVATPPAVVAPRRARAPRAKDAQSAASVLPTNSKEEANKFVEEHESRMPAFDKLDNLTATDSTEKPAASAPPNQVVAAPKAASTRSGPTQNVAQGSSVPGQSQIVAGPQKVNEQIDPVVDLANKSLSILKPKKFDAEAANKVLGENSQFAAFLGRGVLAEKKITGKNKNGEEKIGNVFKDTDFLDKLLLINIKDQNGNLTEDYYFMPTRGREMPPADYASFVKVGLVEANPNYDITKKRYNIIGFRKIGKMKIKDGFIVDGSVQRAVVDSVEAGRVYEE